MIYKKFSLFSMILLTLHCFSQTEGKSGKFQLGLVFSPDICGITSNTANYQVPKFGYTGGLNMCYTINSIFSFEFGLQYSDKGYGIKTARPLFFAGQPYASQVPIAENFNYVDIPLKVNMMLGKSRLRFIGSLGLTTNIFLYTTEVRKVTSAYESANSRSVSRGDYREIGLSPTASAGIDYKISRKLHLRFEPAFRYNLIKIVSTPYKANLWSAGFNIGTYFTL